MNVEFLQQSEERFSRRKGLVALTASQGSQYGFRGTVTVEFIPDV